MKVLHFINNLDREGAQVMVSNLVSGASSGVNYCVCVRKPGGGLAVDLRARGVDVLEPNRYYGFRSILQTFFFVKQCCIEQKADVLHAHMADAASLGWLVARHLKMPLVVTHHGHDILLQCNPVCRTVYHVLLSLAARYAAMNIAVSFSVAERVRKLLRLGEKRVQTIANGVPVPSALELEQYRAAAHAGPASPVLVSVGRLVELKGQEQLIRAVARLVERFPGMRLYILGAGDREQALKQLAEDERVSDQVVFTGAVGEVTKYLAQSDVYLSASRSEGMPVSILEAMACRLPVVASDIPGNRSVVTAGQTGLLFELDNVDDLVEKVTELLLNREFANDLACRARQMVAREYSAAAAESRHAGLYTQILERGAADSVHQES